MNAAAETPTWNLLHTSPLCRGAEHIAYVELRRIELHSETAAFERAVVISFAKNCKFPSIVRKYLRGSAPLHEGNRHLNAMGDAESPRRSL